MGWLISLEYDVGARIVPATLPETSVTLSKFPEIAIRILRVVYTIEFLVALMATLSVWREVGGQYHLDLMPWFVKLLLTMGVATSIVRMTAAAVENKRRKLFFWTSVTAILLLAIGLGTFYYHLNEPPDEDEGAATLSAAISRCLEKPVTQLVSRLFLFVC